MTGAQSTERNAVREREGCSGRALMCVRDGDAWHITDNSSRFVNPARLLKPQKAKAPYKSTHPRLDSRGVKNKSNRRRHSAKRSPCEVVSLLALALAKTNQDVGLVGRLRIRICCDCPRVGGHCFTGTTQRAQFEWPPLSGHRLPGSPPNRTCRTSNHR